MNDIPLSYVSMYLICAMALLFLFPMPALRKSFGNGKALLIALVSAITVVLFFSMAEYSVDNFMTESYLRRLADEQKECESYRNQLDIIAARSQFKWSGSADKQFETVKNSFLDRKKKNVLYQPKPESLLQIHGEVRGKNSALQACADGIEKLNPIE